LFYLAHIKNKDLSTSNCTFTPKP